MTPTHTGIRSQLALLLCVAFLGAAPASSLAAGHHAGHGDIRAEPAPPAADAQQDGAQSQAAPGKDQHESGHDGATGDPGDGEALATKPGHDGGSTADGEAANDQHEADGAAGQQHGGHGEAGDVATDRPVKLALGGFAAVNGLVIVAAAILRRRPASVKRRETLARVQSGAGARRGKKDRS